MKTWSAEDIFVRAYSVAAVGVQGLIDLASGVERITRPPRMGHDVDVPLGLDYTRPLCPANCDCGGCYHNPERNCHCFDGADQSAKREEMEEVSEPRPTYSIDELFKLKARIDGDRWGEPPLSGSELVAVRQLIEERFGDQVFRAGNHIGACAEPNPAVSAVGTSGEAVSGSFPPEQPASPCTDLAAWLEPAVWTGLEPHEPDRVYYGELDRLPGIYCCGGLYVDWQDWRIHVGKPIAQHLAQAIETDWLPRLYRPRFTPK